MCEMIVTLADIETARRTIGAQVLRTPMLPAPKLSALTGAQVWVKYENLQVTNSFKERGAVNKLATLSAAERARGVIAMSAGNHAQAVAYHARRLGIPAAIVMPVTTPFVKVAATEAYGAAVVLHGETITEAQERAEALAADRALVWVHPYDDPHVIAGQGTMAVGAGAAGLAALLANPERFKGRKVGLILCGGNIDPRILASIMVRELERGNQIVSFRLTIPDRPGVLGVIATRLGQLGANILEVDHRRLFLDVPAKGAKLDVTVETRDAAHADAIARALREDGYRPQRIDAGAAME